MTARDSLDPWSDPETARVQIVKLAFWTFVVAVVISTAGIRWTGTRLPSLTGGSVVRMLLTGAVLTVPLLTGLVLIRRTRLRWLRDVWELPAGLLGPGVSRMSTVDLLLVSLSAGVGEELLFRGFLQHWLLPGGLLPALLIPSVLFGLLHWLSPAYAAGAGLIGLYLGTLIAFVPSVGLGALMTGHALYDFAALAVLRRATRADGRSGSDRES